MKDLKRYILPLIAVILVIGSFLMPDAVAGIMDSRRLDNLTIIDTQSISFEIVSELSLPQRIALAASTSAEIMSIETGQIMDIRMAGEKAASELERFFASSGYEFPADEFAVSSGDAVFIIDAADPTINMIVWELVVQHKNSSEVTVTVDDETGIILKMIFHYGDNMIFPFESDDDFVDSAPEPNVIIEVNGDMMHSAAQLLTKMMTEYYGLPIRLAAYELAANGVLAYYRAEMHGDGMDIPMFGVIRSTGFTMNERTS